MTTTHASLTIVPLITLPIIEMDYLKYLRFNDMGGEDITPLQMQKLISNARRRGQEERRG